MANVAELVLSIVGKDNTEGAFKAARGGMEGIEKAAEGAGREAGKFGEKLHGTAEAGGNAEQALRGVSDITNFMGEQFGVQIGPVTQWGAALADVGGGVEGLLKGGPALVAQLRTLPATLGPVIAATWAHVTALLAEAAAFIAANAPIILIIGALALLAAGIYLLVTNWDTITEKVPILGTAFEAVKNVVLGIKDEVIGAFQAVPDFLREHWPEIATIILLPFAPLVILATDAFGIRSALKGAFEDTITFITDKVNGFVSLVKGIPGALGNVKDLLFDKGKDLIQGFVNGMKSVLIPNPLDMVPGGGKVSGALGKVGGLFRAAGGPVSSGQPYIVGEKGPEWFVPSSSGNIIPNGAGGGSIHFNGPITVQNNGMQKDATATLRDVAFTIAAELRARGMWVAA